MTKTVLVLKIESQSCSIWHIVQIELVLEMYIILDVICYIHPNQYFFTLFVCASLIVIQFFISEFQGLLRVTFSASEVFICLPQMIIPLSRALFLKHKTG